MFEVGKEYWVSYGTTEEVSMASIKVLEVEGQWLRVESDKLDSHLNMAAPLYISAKERDREAEEKAQQRYKSVYPSAKQRQMEGDLPIVFTPKED